MILIDLSDLQVSPASDIGTLVALDNKGNTIRAQYIEPASQSDMDILESQMSTIQSHYIPQLNRQEIRMLEIESDISRIREELSSMPSIENRIDTLEQSVDDKLRLQNTSITALNDRLEVVEEQIRILNDDYLRYIRKIDDNEYNIAQLDDKTEALDYKIVLRDRWLKSKFSDYPFAD